jgi:hypothetical protein
MMVLLSWHDRLAFEGGSGADSGGHFYVCERTTELNEHFGDLLHKIQDLEVPLCLSAAAKTRCLEHRLQYSEDLRLDCLWTIKCTMQAKAN